MVFLLSTHLCAWLNRGRDHRGCHIVGAIEAVWVAGQNSWFKTLALVSPSSLCWTTTAPVAPPDRQTPAQQLSHKSNQVR